MKTMAQMLEESLADTMLQRVKDHINRVKYFYDKMIRLHLIPDEDLNRKEVQHHDEDKLEPQNLERQALRFKKDMTEEDLQEIDNVVRDHVKNNPHHCEYWGTPAQDHRSEHIHCERMSDKYLYEMIADWHATAEEKGNTVMSYFNKVNGDRFLFSKRQQEIIKRCAEALEKFMGKPRKYSDVYIDPADVKKITQI